MLLFWAILSRLYIYFVAVTVTVVVAVIIIVILHHLSIVDWLIFLTILFQVCNYWFLFFINQNKIGHILWLFYHFGNKFSKIIIIGFLMTLKSNGIINLYSTAVFSCLLTYHSIWFCLSCFTFLLLATKICLLCSLNTIC
jgi:hypothetical protein